MRNIRTTKRTKSIASFEFQDGDRSFTCIAASSPATPGTDWWWLSISGESHRYAAFRADPDDTEATLRPRIVAYYEQLLADRARPRELRTPWAGRKPVPAPAVPVTGTPEPIDGGLTTT